MAEVYIGLGSNLGNRDENLSNAINFLSEEKVKIIKKSSIDETEPVDFLNQPKFLNQIVFVETELNPFKLLNILKGIENKVGRVKSIDKGPRIIDLDILLYDDKIIADDILTIPHPGILHRGFILKHLIELDNNLKDPILGKFYYEVYHEEQNK